jgi:SNF2 family DNA or RNA helicase
MLRDILAKVKTELRPYQLEAIEKMAQSNNFLEFDDMGLGKTVTTLYSILEKLQDCTEYNVLVLCSVNGLGVWKEELEKWFQEDCLIYNGSPLQRQRQWVDFTKDKKHFLITTYGVAAEIPLLWAFWPHTSLGHWDALICDEIHAAGLLREKNKTYLTVKKIKKKVEYLCLLTGTPIRQGVIDLYAPLHLVDEKQFDSYWHYVNKYCITIQTPFGKNIERNPRDIQGFRAMLNKYMVRRLKSEVLQDLPGKQRNPIPLTMTPKQAKAHNEVLEQLYHATEDDLVVATSVMTAILRARQILVTPRLVGIDDDGAALPYLMEAGEALLIADRPFVVYTPFRQALFYIHDAIERIGIPVHFYELHGGMTPAAFANEWQGFEKDPNPHKVLLCVIKSGASFHATAAADCFFLGYEWDFNLNVQSEDRLCRLGQKNFVNCNYVLHDGNTVDEDVKRKLNDKQIAADWIIGTEEQYIKMLVGIKNPLNR